MNKITIVAEAGINHSGNMATAKELILRAKECCIDIFKTQAYSVEALFPNHKIMTQGKNWYEEVLKTELTKEQLFQIADWCEESDIEFLCSAFDTERLGWLEEIGVKRHKIATKMNRNYEYINEVAKTRKPIIISSNIDAIEIKYQWSYRINTASAKTNWLYCLPEYPTELNHLEFDRFDFGIQFDGFSDHSVGIEASVVAMTLGASIIEKHFCLRRDNSNPDMICSAEPNEMKQIVQWARKIEEILV